jgi:hypothetical protein
MERDAPGGLLGQDTIYNTGKMETQSFRILVYFIDLRVTLNTRVLPASS